MLGDLTIGQLSKETGCKVTTIRYFEEIGLIPKPVRTEGNQRRYGSDHVTRLSFIRHSRELGFSQPTIRELLELTDSPTRSCEMVTEIARAHLHGVDQRIARLLALKRELERMITECQGGSISDCRIIETLADLSHGHCLAKEH